MNDDIQTALEALWDELSALPPAQRDEFLRTTHLDAELRAELESLIAHADRAQTFFGRIGSLLPDVVEAAAVENADASATASSIDPLLGQKVGHYVIEGRLGSGGMGIVYRAHDTRLQRTVALKFLTARLLDDARASERFLTEARAAAALDHTNICTIHEVGGSADTPAFIAMAFYAGETLEQLLQRGPLAPALAVDIATQIARGLAAAHARGIVHRDVKPGNVMITADDVVKLLDFGIARIPDVQSNAGLTPGTIAYMSPEQVRSRAVDRRSDLWALGVVLYEMCTGVRPFSRDDHGATLHAILHDTPAAPSTLRADVPAHIDVIIDRLLQKDPLDRYDTADDLLADLAGAFDPAAFLPRARPRARTRQRRFAVAAGLVLSLAAGATLWVQATAAPVRVLVADVEGDTVFGRAVSERLRQSLASPALTVAGRPSLEAALIRMGREPDVRLTPAIARELAIREGFRGYVHVTVDRLGKAFAIGAVLIEAESGDFIDHHQSIAMDASALPAEADRLASGLKRTLSRSLKGLPESSPLLAVTTDSMSALQRHLQAVQANRNGDFRRGIQLHDETIRIDPAFADAHQTRAFALEQIGLRAGRAQNSIMRANALRAKLTRHEQYSVEADYFWHVQGDLGSAITALHNSHEAVREIEPGRVLNRRSYGLALMLHSDLEEAERVLQVGRQFAPCPPTNSHLVSVLHGLGRDDEARTVLEQALDKWPTNPLLGMDRAHFLARAGSYRDAHADARRLDRGYTAPFGLRAQAVFDAVEGRMAEAIDHLEQLRDEQLAAGMLSPALEVAAAIGRMRLITGDSAGAVKQLDEFLTRHPMQSLEAAERPYLSLALFFADAGASQRARQLVAEYDADVPATFKGPDRWMQQRVRAAILVASDSAAQALTVLRAASNSDRIWTNWLDNLLFVPDQRPELARVYDRLGQRDSAIAVYERYLNARVLYRTEMDALHMAHALRRLAALHTQRQPARAAMYERRLQQLWQHADTRLKRTWGI